jgi:hypothetical protein
LFKIRKSYDSVQEWLREEFQGRSVSKWNGLEQVGPFDSHPLGLQCHCLSSNHG